MSLNSTIPIGDTKKARLFYSGGSRDEFHNQQLAYEIYMGARKGVRIAFRGKGDTTPVYPWELVDRL